MLIAALELMRRQSFRDILYTRNIIKTRAHVRISYIGERHRPASNKDVYINLHRSVHVREKPASVKISPISLFQIPRCSNYYFRTALLFDLLIIILKLTFHQLSSAPRIILCIFLQSLCLMFKR